MKLSGKREFKWTHPSPVPFPQFSRYCFVPHVTCLMWWLDITLISWMQWFSNGRSYRSAKHDCYHWNMCWTTRWSEVKLEDIIWILNFIISLQLFFCEFGQIGNLALDASDFQNQQMYFGNINGMLGGFIFSNVPSTSPDLLHWNQLRSSWFQWVLT